MQNEPEFIILEDADGIEEHYEVVSRVQYSGNEYVVLLPAIEKADEYIILRKRSDDEYEGISDENELTAVFKKFLEENDQE